MAINFRGRIPSNPAYVAEKKLFRDFLLSQFLPWTCSVNQVTLLRVILSTVELQFCEIPDLSTDAHKVGAICDYTFNPGSGMVPIPQSWNELEGNSISERLKGDSLIAKIPGKQDGLGVEDFVLAFFKKSLYSSEYLRIEKRDYIPGLPIDHCGRKISVRRYRIVEKFNEKEVRLNMAACKTHLASNLDFPDDVEIDPYSFEDLDRTIICVLSIYWKPNLGESSLESLERFIEMISQSFNQAISVDDLNKEGYESTREILERRGTIIFEEFSEDFDS